MQDDNWVIQDSEDEEEIRVRGPPQLPVESISTATTSIAHNTGSLALSDAINKSMTGHNSSASLLLGVSNISTFTGASRAQDNTLSAISTFSNTGGEKQKDSGSAAARPRPRPRIKVPDSNSLTSPDHSSIKASSSVARLEASTTDPVATEVTNVLDFRSEPNMPPSIADRAKMRSRGTKSVRAPSSSSPKSKSGPKEAAVDKLEVISISSDSDFDAAPSKKKSKRKVVAKFGSDKTASRPSPRTSSRSPRSTTKANSNVSLVAVATRTMDREAFPHGPDTSSLPHGESLPTNSSLPPSDPLPDTSALFSSPPDALPPIAVLHDDNTPSPPAAPPGKRRRTAMPVGTEDDEEGIDAFLRSDRTSDKNGRAQSGGAGTTFFTGSSSLSPGGPAVDELDMDQPPPKKKKTADEGKSSAKRTPKPRPKPRIKKINKDEMTAESHAGLEVVIKSKPKSKPKSTSDSRKNSKEMGKDKQKDEMVFKSKEFIDDSDEDELGGAGDMNSNEQPVPLATTSPAEIGSKPQTPERPRQDSERELPVLSNNPGAEGNDEQAHDEQASPVKLKSKGEKTKGKRKAVMTSDEDDHDDQDNKGPSTVPAKKTSRLDSVAKKIPSLDKRNDPGKAPSTHSAPAKENKIPQSAAKMQVQPAAYNVYTPVPLQPPLGGRTRSIAGGKVTPMSELIRRVNSLPGSPFAPSPALSGSGTSAYSPHLKFSRHALSRIAPLHPNRRTPPPPLPPPPPPKKTRAQLALEEKWEEELADSVEGWTCMTDEERAALRKAKREREMGGWED